MDFPYVGNNSKFKVLYVRLSSLGDVVMASHVARMFKERFPNCQLTWLTEKIYEPLVSELPWVDEIICWDRAGTGNKGFLRLVGAIRKQHYDVLFNMHGNDRTLLLALFGGFSFKLGFHKHYQFVYHQNVYRYLERAGIPLNLEKSIASSLVRPSGDSALSAVKSSGAVIAALAIGASHIRKRWPEKHWKLLIEALLARHCQVVLLGAGQEEETVALSLERSFASGRVMNLVGKISLRELVRVIADSSLLVSGDTGPLHIGRALGKKTIALFGPTVLAPEYMESFTKVLYTPCESLGCLNWKCNEPCMERIDASLVIDAAADVLNSLDSQKDCEKR